MYESVCHSGSYLLSFISDQGISPQVFITLDDKDIDEIGFSFGGKRLLKSRVKELKHTQEHAAPDESDPVELGKEYSGICTMGF